MLAVAAHGHALGVDRLDRAHRVALDTGDLHQAADRIAGQAEIVLHADLGGVLDLVDRAAERRGEAAGGHRAGHADFALATDLGARDRGIFLVQDADRAGGEQERDHAVVVRAGHEAMIVVQHGRDDAGGAVGRRGDDTAAGGVLLVDRERVQIHPVEDRQRIAQRRLGALAQFAVHRRRAPLHLEPARQHAAVANAAGDAILHRLPDGEQPLTDFRLAAPGLLVFQHDPGDGLAGIRAQPEQFVAGMERVRQRRGVGHDAVFGGLVVVDHEAAADGVVVARREHLAVGGERGEAHAVAVVGQLLALVEDEIGLFVERDLVLAEHAQTFAIADALEPRRNGIGIDPVGPLALEAAQHRLVGAVAATGVGERAEQLGAQPRDFV